MVITFRGIKITLNQSKSRKECLDATPSQFEYPKSNDQCPHRRQVGRRQESCQRRGVVMFDNAVVPFAKSIYFGEVLWNSH
ncbi:hypothetical protein TNCT_12761 [Trichonephila clavata]|uniref:Uncharacterized protein n=1 Tax=Trichonephila clavata TaxID=2740835 RepID=A0A8X6HB82_TRICU|nr:hypothetical protein TNCT_12761 [Trichonephila clavata]